MFTKDFDKTENRDQATPNAVQPDVASLPFRERLNARKAERVQSTLGIVAGIDSDEEAVTARRRNRETYHATAAGTGALGSGGFDDTHALSRRGGGRGDGGAGGGDFDDEGGSRLGDISQFAFAGLAVLGLAGLSVLAAESALKGPDNGKAPNPGPSGDASAGAATVASVSAQPGDTSTTALTTAANNQVSATPWFDYRGAADMLAKLAADREADRLAAAEAEAAATKIAESDAAAAIADAEATRLAEEAAQAAAASTAAAEADAAEAKRLADIEAARVAELEAEKLAQAEADAKAAALAEEKRLAELEAKRVAAAEAETKRLAEAEAERKAKAAAEVKRLAAIEKANAEAAAAQKLADEKAAAERAEATRLAKIEADRAAKAEQVRLAKAEADRKAAIAAAKPAPVQRAAPAPIQFVAYTGDIPEPASRKPSRPSVTLASAAPTRRVVSTTPTEYYGSTRTSVRPLGQSVQRTAAPVESSQTVDDFLASRVQKTASSAVSMTELAGLKAQFLDLVETGSDGARRTLVTPDGREVNVYLESTRPIEAVTKTIRTIDYSTISSTDTSRFEGNTVPVKVSVMCRDVSYAFPGQERGRFAACQRADGGWMLARAADPGAQPT